MYRVLTLGPGVDLSQPRYSVLNSRGSALGLMTGRRAAVPSFDCGSQESSIYQRSHSVNGHRTIESGSLCT